MEKENETIIRDLAHRLPTMESVKPLVIKRDRIFQEGKKQIENLKSAKIPEPNLKLSGGPKYKNVNYKKQINEAVVNLRDKYQKINQEIGKNAIKELKDLGIDKETKIAEKEGVHKLLDKGLEKHKSKGKTDLATNKDIRRYIREQGFNPDKTKDQEKPLDREPTEKIPDPVKSETKSKEVKTMEKNKRDMGMDRDR